MDFEGNLESFLDYQEAGFRVFELHNIGPNGACECGQPDCEAIGKHPRRSNYQNSPEAWGEDQLEVIAMTMRTGFGVLVDDRLVIDIDPRNGGNKSYERLVQDTGIDFKSSGTLTVATGGGGWHIYYKRPGHILLRGSLPQYPGIDIKSSGFVVGYGSLHKSGLEYERHAGWPDKLLDAPQALIKLLERPAIVRVSVDGADHNLSHEQLAEMVAAIPNPGRDYDAYINLGMAIHAATDGEGFELWDEWSRRSEYNNPTANIKKWASFRAGGGITAGTLVHMAKQAGWVEPVTFHPLPMAMPEPEEETTEALRIPAALADTVIGRLAKRAAYCLEFPEMSTFMSILGAASAAVCTNYSVRYQGSSDAIATGLYVVVEQPPATQKSRLLNVALKPYEDSIRRHNEYVVQHNAGVDDDDPQMLYAFGNTTDTTAAALERALASGADGRFCIASAEQSAFMSLFPSGNNFHSTNELALKGYAGENVSGLRTDRKTFAGVAYGTIVLVAQPGSCGRIFSASNGSGLAERFMYVSEPSMLGARTLHGEPLSDSDLLPIRRAVERCVQKYSERMAFNVDGKQKILEDTVQLRATSTGYLSILERRRAMEAKMGALLDSGDMVAVSWLGKFETHVLKVASVMHVIESLAEAGEVPDMIGDDMIEGAMQLVDVMASHLTTMLHDAGESGEKTEESAIIEVLSEKPLTVREAAQKLRFRAPYRAMGKDAYKRATGRLRAMCEDGLILIDQNGRLRNV